METQYGPSSNRHKLIRKKQLMRDLFGTDSEEEQTNKNQNKTVNKNKKLNASKIKQALIAQLREELHNSTESESEDVLQITIENDHFVTPDKVLHAHKSSSISPVANTSIHTHTFITPSKQTNTCKESLTSTVKHIFQQTIKNVELVSPLQKTPSRNEHSHPFVSPIKAIQTQTHGPSKDTCSVGQLVHCSQAKPNHTLTHNSTVSLAQHQADQQQNHTHFAKSKSLTNSSYTHIHPNVSSAQHQANNKQLQTHTHNKNKNTSSYVSSAQHQSNQQQIHTYTQAPNRFAHSHKGKRTANKNTRFQPYQVASNTRALWQNQAFNSRPHSFNSITRTHTENTAFNSRSHTINSNARTHAQNTAIVSSTFARPHSHKHIKQTVLVDNTTQLQPTTHTHTPAQASVFTPPESLTITISNTEQLNSSTQKQTVLEEPQNLNRISKSSPPKTKVITLNNKYVPKGVHLAIAVEHNKKLSKNALKKITRNLASQL